LQVPVIGSLATDDPLAALSAPEEVLRAAFPMKETLSGKVGQSLRSQVGHVNALMRRLLLHSGDYNNYWVSEKAIHIATITNPSAASDSG
jgi:hypothetical protein